MNEKKVNEDYKKRKELSQFVVKDNVLVQRARFDLTTNQQKFLSYIISKIKPTDVEIGVIDIKVSDFCATAGIDKDWFYSEFREMIDSIDKKCFWVNEGQEHYKFRWFSDTRYSEGKGLAKITLAKTFQDYLIGLVNNYTQYELWCIMALKSKYAIRLFEICKSYAYQKRREIDIDELKELLNATNYKNYSDFSKRVLEPAINEINEFTDLKISYETVKVGRKVVAIVFLINDKKWFESYQSYQKTICKISPDDEIEGQYSFDDYTE